MSAADRVLTTTQAEQTITQMQGTINGQFFEAINTLDSQGKTLSDPNVWDGNKAAQFREDWAASSQALKNAHTQLQQLNQLLGTIAADIRHAGGNS